MTEPLTHLDEQGRARMVDVSDKPHTIRQARARGQVRMALTTLEAALAGNGPKGDVRAIAELAGVMAAKKTADLIPLCHPLPLSLVRLEISPDRDLPGFVINAEVRTQGPTGVEMEALTGVSVACLTLYDMLKALDRDMVIGGIEVLAKSGGRSGPIERVPSPWS